jgi:hypothetical protein
MLNQIVADSGTGTESRSVRFGMTPLSQLTLISRNQNRQAAAVLIMLVFWRVLNKSASLAMTVGRN